MRHFSVNLGIRSEDEENDVSPRTLMISGVPDTYCTKEFIHRHVTEAYGDETIVEEVQIAYDVSKLGNFSWLNPVIFSPEFVIFSLAGSEKRKCQKSQNVL